jgi:predicted nucleic acid-binding protein
MIVADTNLIVYFHVDGQWTSQAEQVATIDPHWVAPFLWRSEFRNTLALYLRKQLLTFEDIADIVQRAERQMYGNEYPISSMAVLNLVKTSACTAYDCEFVALAQMLSVSLITTDKKVLKEFPQVAIHPEEFIGYSRT